MFAGMDYTAGALSTAQLWFSLIQVAKSETWLLVLQVGDNACLLGVWPLEFSHARYHLWATAWLQQTTPTTPGCLKSLACDRHNWNRASAREN